MTTQEFLAAYKKDDNIFWATEGGYIQNALDSLVEALEDICEWSYGGNVPVPNGTYERIHNRAREALQPKDF